MSPKKRKVFDFEIERARRAFDDRGVFRRGAEVVIVVLQSAVHSGDPTTREGLIELRSLCRRIEARVAELLAIRY